MKKGFMKMVALLVMLTLAVGFDAVWGLSATKAPSFMAGAKADGVTIMPMADIIDWRYMVVDGKLYRRLYNYSKQQWIGEWELCL